MSGHSKPTVKHLPFPLKELRRKIVAEHGGPDGLTATEHALLDIAMDTLCEARALRAEPLDVKTSHGLDVAQLRSGLNSRAHKILVRIAARKRKRKGSKLAELMQSLAKEKADAAGG